jgi:Family of unknown function (DUF5677)
MSLISRGDEDLAIRYLAHEAVEEKKALRVYEECRESLGYKPFTKREVQKIRANYEAAIPRYGKSFKGEYGWAADHLQIVEPRFSDLQSASGFGRMRSHYRMASQNVHAGVKEIRFRLGLLRQDEVMLAGPSNAGLEEPGQNAAITLSQLTVVLPQAPFDLDTLVKMQVLNLVQPTR